MTARLENFGKELLIPFSIVFFITKFIEKPSLSSQCYLSHTENDLRVNFDFNYFSRISLMGVLTYFCLDHSVIAFESILDSGCVSNCIRHAAVFAHRDRILELSITNLDFLGLDILLILETFQLEWQGYSQLKVLPLQALELVLLAAGYIFLGIDTKQQPIELFAIAALFLAALEIFRAFVTEVKTVQSFSALSESQYTGQPSFFLCQLILMLFSTSLSFFQLMHIG